MITDDLIYYEIFKSTEKFENVLFDWGKKFGVEIVVPDNVEGRWEIICMNNL
jgi:hypothetical protein